MSIEQEVIKAVKANVSPMLTEMEHGLEIARSSEGSITVSRQFAIDNPSTNAKHFKVSVRVSFDEEEMRHD